MDSYTIDNALERFGKESFRSSQREVISAVLAGESCLCVFPTGMGKSLCYQLPATLLDGVSVVVSPLIALMRDQVEGMKRLGVKAMAFHSGLDDTERKEVLERVREGNIRLLYVAPESLRTNALDEALKFTKLGLFVIDEAHCLSQWGHSFRQDYLGLPAYTRTRKFHAILTVTATAGERVRDELAEQFGVPEKNIFLISPTRHNIVREVKTVTEERKNQSVVEFLSTRDHLPCIVYVRGRQDSEDLARILKEHGISVRAYHAGLPAEAREDIEKDFLMERVDILTATIAFGMGVDKQNVRSVIHYHAPTSVEAYVQESGRAGRDGLEARSLVFLSQSDVVDTTNRHYASTPEESSLRLFMRPFENAGELTLSTYGETTRCDLPETVMKRILFDWEMKNKWVPLSSGYYYYHIKPLFPLEEILHGREEEEKTWLTWINNNREGEVAHLAHEFCLSWAEAYEWISSLEQTGEWQVKFRQICTHGKVDSAGISIKEEIAYYVDYYENMRQSTVKKMQDAYQILLGSICFNVAIAQYLGFPQEQNCGFCSACLKEKREITTLSEHTIDDAITEQIFHLAQTRNIALQSPAQWTRFLLGFLSPAQIRARLWAHPLYGILKSHPWENIYALASELPH